MFDQDNLYPSVTDLLARCNTLAKLRSLGAMTEEERRKSLHNNLHLIDLGTPISNNTPQTSGNQIKRDEELAIKLMEEELANLNVQNTRTTNSFQKKSGDFLRSSVDSKEQVDRAALLLHYNRTIFSNNNTRTNNDDKGDGIEIVNR